MRPFKSPRSISSAATGHYTTKLRQQALAGALPDVALVQLGPFWGLADHFADLGKLLSGPDQGEAPLQETLNPGAVAAFRVHGIQKGLPVSGGNLAIPPTW